MSFYPIPKERFGTAKVKPKLDPEVKARKKRDNEKVTMPKGTTIKQVQQLRKEIDYNAKLKIKEIEKLIINNNVDISNQYEVNRLVSLLILNNVFGNKIEAKTFVIAFKDFIIDSLKRFEEI
jgi:hypothetical protein